MTDRSIDFLRSRDRSKPFFLKVSYVRPHPPFDAPQQFFDLYKNRTLAPPPVGNWADKERLQQKGHITDSDTGPLDTALLHQARAGYYACISHIDNQVGRILNALKQHELEQNTVVLFCSDHGELLGDHHTYRKVRPYQGSIRIPMILFNAGIFGEQKDITELRDIMPTCLELAQAETPQECDGISMLHPNNRTYLHGEHSGGEIGNHYIVTKTDKFCRFSQTGKEQYFDLQNDPQELQNKIHRKQLQPRIETLRKILIRELADREEGYSDGTKLIAGKQQKNILSFLENGQTGKETEEWH